MFIQAATLIKSTVTFRGRTCIWTLYVDRVWMTQVNTAVKISNKYTSLIRSLSTPSSGQNTVHELSIWPLVRNVVTYILQLLLWWLTWINTPRWQNLPGLNHSKLGWKKAKQFNLSDLCSWLQWALFSNVLKASTAPTEVEVGCGGFKTMSHLQCPELRFHLPSHRYSIIAPSQIPHKKHAEFPAHLFLPCEQLFIIILLFLQAFKSLQGNRAPWGPIWKHYDDV